mmetsp:Transcript_69377/g.185075  ORF Transcript_69377/g.185075 Transcript_69377/m.185075 type:complete len:370 (+) Transcript_69377:81-1190(+)
MIALQLGLLLIVFIIVIFIVVVVVLGSGVLGLLGLLGLALLLVLLALLLIDLGLHLGLLGLQGHNLLLGDLLGIGRVVANKDVVEDSAGLDLPELETNDATVVDHVVKSRVINEVGIVDIRSNPLALVSRVLDLLGLPLALVSRVVDQRGLPLAIGLLIPVIRLLRVRVNDLLRDIIITIRFLVLGVVDLLTLIPILGLGGLGVLDTLRRKHVPILVKAATLDLLQINLNLIGVVRLQNESVDVGLRVSLGPDLGLDKVVLALVGEDHVHLLGGIATNVRTEHDLIIGVTAPLLLVNSGRGNLNVATTAVKVLLVLDSVLEDQGLVLVGERSGLGRDVVPTVVSGGAETFVVLIAVEGARRRLPSALIS